VSAMGAALLLRPDVLAAFRVEGLAVVRPIGEVDGDIDGFLGHEGADLSAERHRDGALGPSKDEVAEEPTSSAVGMPLAALGPGSVDRGALGGRSKEEVPGVPQGGGPEATGEGTLQEGK
jgi:hypothetical protein